MEKKKSIRVGWKLFAFLFAFVFLMLAIIWLFQIRLLDYFYKNTKYKELQVISDIITEYVDTESLDEAVYSCAVDYSTCIRVFRQNNKVAVEIASADVAAECLIHDISQKKLLEYYQHAKENGGVYAVTNEMRPKLGSFWSVSDPRSTYLIDRIHSGAVTVGMVYSVIVTGEDGAEYLVMLNSELTPVDATVNTLKTQFGWIAGVLFVATVILAILISRNISKPIEKMNRSAKKFAEGRYDVEFDGKGYREAHELADSLNHASSELSRLDSLQKELIANVSHDLRTPLTMIKGYTEVMRDIPGENTPENLQVIADEADHLGELVSDMLDLSKIRAGARQPQMAPFSLTDAVRDVMTRYEKLICNEGYRIEFDADEDVFVVADRMMLLQVVYNLINNAVHYAGSDKTVLVTQRVENWTVRISVIDHGEGIAPESLDSIWDRYYKIDRVHKRAAVGTGLGLSIVKGILELHRATYGVESSPGVGSSFWFSLPVEEPSEEEGNVEDMT